MSAITQLAATGRAAACFFEQTGTKVCTVEIIYCTSTIVNELLCIRIAHDHERARDIQSEQMAELLQEKQNIQAERERVHQVFLNHVLVAVNINILNKFYSVCDLDRQIWHSLLLNKS